MAGSISEFKASFNELARPNRFDVSIPVPLTLIPYVSSAKILNYRCEVASLPSRTFSTAEQKIGSNPTEKYPYQTTYNDMDLTFMVDEDMNQKIFFDAWLNFINPTYNFNFRYKEDYATTITINQYDVQNNLTYSVNLYDVYPISVNQLDLDWSNNDSYHKLVVSFAYTRWENNSLQALGMELVDAGISAVSDMVGGLGGSAAGAIGTSLNNFIASPNLSSAVTGAITNIGTGLNNVLNNNSPDTSSLGGSVSGDDLSVFYSQ